MPWYAVAAVDDAVDATRGFLFPFSLVRWTKLAFLVVFMGAGVSTRVSLPIPPRDTLPEGVPAGYLPAIPPFARETVIVVGAAVVLLGVLLAVVMLTLQFVFYDALRADEVRLWAPFRDRFGQAVRLFGFQLGLVVLAVAPIALGAYALIDVDVDVGALHPASWALVGLVVLTLVVLLALALRFTDEFVIPVMTLFDLGPVAGWRRFWPTLRENWIQFLAYLVVHFFLALGITIAEGVVVFLLGGIVLALGALVALVVIGALGGLEIALASVAGVALLGTLGLVVVVTLLVVLIPIRILVTTYLRTYELCVLGGTNPEFMLLPESVVAEPEVLENHRGQGGDGTLPGEGESQPGEGGSQPGETEFVGGDETTAEAEGTDESESEFEFTADDDRIDPEEADRTGPEEADRTGPEVTERTDPEDDRER